MHTHKRISSSMRAQVAILKCMFRSDGAVGVAFQDGPLSQPSYNTGHVL